jgi:hypothetical protein
MPAQMNGNELFIIEGLENFTIKIRSILPTKFRRIPILTSTKNYGKGQPIFLV